MLSYGYTGLEAKYNGVFKWTIFIIQDVIMALIKLKAKGVHGPRHMKQEKGLRSLDLNSLWIISHI